MSHGIIRTASKKLAAVLLSGTLVVTGAVAGAPVASAKSLESAFPGNSSLAQAARQLKNVPGFKDVTAEEYQANRNREANQQAARLRVINNRRTIFGVNRVGTDPIAEMLAHVSAEVFRDWQSRNLWETKAPHSQEGKCLIRTRTTRGLFKQEYCYRPFVIRNSPVRPFDYWVDRVSFGERLFSERVVSMGISGAPRNVSLIGNMRDLVVVVLKTEEPRAGWVNDKPWDTALLRILVNVAQQWQQEDGSDPEQQTANAALDVVKTAVLLPIYQVSLQQAFNAHGVPVGVSPSVRAQMWSDSLAATVQARLERDNITPERVAFEMAQLPLTMNVHKSQNQWSPFVQHIFVTPTLIDPFTVFRNINAGDTLFREKHSKFGVTALRLNNGNIMWFVVSQK
ncbi:MAG: hypothetical protein WAN89_04975 [Lawsonella sp.]